MKKKQVKKIGKYITKEMSLGMLPEQLIGNLDLTEEQFKKILEENEFLNLCFRKGLIKMKGFYATKLLVLIDNPYANKDAIRIFFSHHLDVIEKKFQITDKQNVDVEDILKEVAERLPV